MAIDFRQCLLNLDNVCSLAGLEVKLGQTWSPHGPNMALTCSQKSRPSLDMTLDHIDTVFKISEQYLVLKKCCSKNCPNKVQTWFWHLPIKQTLHGHKPYTLLLSLENLMAGLEKEPAAT